MRTRQQFLVREARLLYTERPFCHVGVPHLSRKSVCWAQSLSKTNQSTQSHLRE